MVVANPPYMGSSSLGKWMGAWVKKHCPEAYRDLCTSFIDRGFGMSADNGYSAMVTMQSWMFLGSFEKLRSKILCNHSISSMAHLGTRAFGAIGGEVVSTTATVFANAKFEAKGAYFRLVDMGSEEEKQAGLLEALANPDCGWFYRADASGFETIPGSPIAYWASEAAVAAFAANLPLLNFGKPRHGMSTGNNDACLRQWFEIDYDQICFSATDLMSFDLSGLRYAPYNKGGEARKWYGNDDYVIAFDRSNREVMKTNNGYRSSSSNFFFHESLNWSDVTSGDITVRHSPNGFVFDGRGASLFCRAEYLYAIHSFLNSSVASSLLALLNSSVTYNIDNIASLPFSEAIAKENSLSTIVVNCIFSAKADWDSFENSWNFRRHPLL